MKKSKFRAGDIITVNDQVVDKIELLDYLPSFIVGENKIYGRISDHTIETINKENIGLICKVWHEEEYAPLSYECIVNGVRGFILDTSEDNVGLDNCLKKVDV